MKNILRQDKLKLGLTPLAVYDAANDNTDGCNDALLAELQARLLARQDRLVLVNERILVVSGNLDGVAAREASVATRKAELEAILAGVNPTNTDRIASLTERIATLETRLTDLESRITTLETRIEDLNARVTRLEAAIVRISERIDRVQARCDAGTGGGTSTAQLYFLHSDHLGKTQFATDSAGTVVWDGGINTPFGESVTLASAFAQNLMFPGQYRDDESGLSHNWHRTYDPTLGRYLQSDPIGLAGGINRYAYVGGNPTGTIDPTGEVAIGGAAASIGTGYLISKALCQDYTMKDAILDGALGFLGVGILSKANKLNRIRKLKKAAKRDGMGFTGKTAGGVETYAGNNLKRLKIKRKPAKNPNVHKDSKRPRASYRVGPGEYRDPLTGITTFGKQSKSAHIPLEPPLGLPKSVGVGIGAGAVNSSQNCDC